MRQTPLAQTGGGSWGLQTESPATYTSFGVADPMLTLKLSG